MSESIDTTTEYIRGLEVAIDRLQNELLDAQTMFRAVVEACGGTVRVPNGILMEPPDVLTRWDDKITGAVVFRASRGESVV